MSLVEMLKRRFYLTYRNYFSRAYLYEGVLKSGHVSVRCLFVDNDKFYLQVLQKLFRESPTLVSTFRCRIRRLKCLITSPGLDVDMCIANVALRHASLFEDCATFVMQTRVNQTLDIASALDTNKRYRNQRKETEKQISKIGLTSRISRSHDDFVFFYHRMFLPLIRKFGDAAMLETFEELKQIFEKGLLVLVLYNGEPISGSLSYEHEGVFTHSRAGLLDGDHSLLKLGAMAATYFFLLEYAREQGYRKVDFMRSLPFLNDGVFMHKQHWGAQTESFDGATSWVYLFNRGNAETLARVIENMPLIVHTRYGLEGVISISDEEALSPGLEKKLASQYGAPGLGGLQIVRQNGTIERIKLEH